MKPATTNRERTGRAPGLLAVVGLLLLIAMTGATYSEVFRRLWRAWGSSPDLSHGYLVPLWSGYLLWLRRDKRPAQVEAHWTSFLAGLLMTAFGAGVHCLGVYYRSTNLEMWSLLPYLFGLTLCLGGWKAAGWAWPSILFLAFMIPLPGAISRTLGATLQQVATVSSTYLLQLIGVPAVSQGNVILLSQETIGVAEACNGLRMLTSFIALSAGACFVVQRPAWQKFVLMASAPAIGVVANVARITITGLAYEMGGPKIADAIFHDLAGWLMMPLGIALLFLLMGFLSRGFPKTKSPMTVPTSAR